MEEQQNPLKDPKTLVVVAGFLSFGLGMGIGYILGKRQKKFIHAVPPQDWSLADMAGVPDPDTDMVEKTKEEFDPRTPEQVEEGKAFIENILSAETEEEVVEVVRQTIFNDVDDEWNYEEELAKRNDENPYVLHRDEFYADERGYSQTTLTYYAGDDILVDQDDKPIYNHATIVGPLIFGHGSGDQNVFYIRNDKLHAEYEILRDQGLYSVEVLGLEIEENARVTDLQHSGDRKFRQD